MSTTAVILNPVKEQLSDIASEVSWAKISQRYFGKSASWLYNKINGVDGNSGQGGFTESEKQQLREALYDFANLLRTTADGIS